MSTFQVIDVSNDSLNYRSVVAHLGDAPAPQGLKVGGTLDAFAIAKDQFGAKTVTNNIPQIVRDAVILGVVWDPLADLFDGLFT